MPTRPIFLSDIPAMGAICAAAFQDDELFGDLLNPYRKKYPADFVSSWEWKLWRKWFDFDLLLLVSTDEETGKAVGVAIWERMGEGGKLRARARGWWDLRRLGSPAAELTTRLTSYFYPNRAADPSKSNVLDDSHAICGHLWEGERTENWYLDLLAVHPDFQGKGHGKELVLRGLEEAKKEGVPASVISAFGKTGFYGKYGFKEVGRANVGPLSEIKGGAVMFTGV